MRAERLCVALPSAAEARIVDANLTNYVQLKKYSGSNPLPKFDVKLQFKNRNKYYKLTTFQKFIAKTKTDHKHKNPDAFYKILNLLYTLSIFLHLFY